MSKVKIAVLISGRGSNMGALARAAMDPDYPAEIVLVLSNRPHVAGLELAMEHDLPIAVVHHQEYDDRDAHEDAVTEAIEEAGAELVCLAGYMRILNEKFVNHWRGRIINIHPSLLPAFRGVDTHARVLERGARFHGCTAHFVNLELDGGPIIAQAIVAVDPNDTEETLAERVLAQEHRLYPHALKLIASNQVRWSGDEAVANNEVTKEDLALFEEDD
ncbi:MAG: phosphoribosylglycinamide formyltransferase [Pseudomonadota bacterium]